MKKTLVALAVAAVAASASATTVYSQDGTKVDVGGSVQVALGKFGKDQRTDLRNDESHLVVDAEHNLGNGLKALAGVQFRFDADSADDNTFNNPTAYHLFVGFGHADVGTVTFGKQDTTLDGVQLSDFTYWGGNNNLPVHTEKLIKFQSAEWAGFSFGLDYLFGESNKVRGVDSESAYRFKYGYGVSAFYNRELVQDLKLSLAAGYAVNRNDDETTTRTVNKEISWRTSAQLAYGPVVFGAEYGRSINKHDDDSKEKLNSLLVSAKYQVIEPSAIYIQWQRDVEKSTDTKTTTNAYFVGADYKFNKNVVAFVEYARATTKEGSDKVRENIYGTGLRVFF